MPRYLYKWDPETRKFYEVFRVRAEQKAPSLHLDEIAPTYSHADGKTYTSKKALSDSMERGGFRLKEPGQKYKKKSCFGNEQEIIETAQKARTMVRDGMAPLSEWDKHVCKMEAEKTSKPK